ncbi:MAG: hypothetical protein NW201_01175 [Gemmatimonadales bacterium]|nr:hypothetical protein [Gemmatimonadales bacterium]
MSRGRPLALALLALAALAPPLRAQGERCFLLVNFVGDTGRRIQSPDGVNYFAGGGVRLSCRGTQITMESDSVAAYGGNRVDFVGRVKYRDSTLTLDAERGTYYRDGERFEARGKVRTRNTRSGSTLEGPSLDYFRAVRGVRDSSEVYAIGRPLIRYRDTSPDSATGRAAEPYVIVGDRVRLRGDDRLWSGGNVTVDRSDFHAEGDSLRLDTGAANDGTLIGKALLKGAEADSFAVTGARVDFTLQRREVTRVKAQGEGEAKSRGRTVQGDTVLIELERRRAVRTASWGTSRRGSANADGYDVLGDSVVMETPGQVLREVRAYRAAWVGTAKDSATGERDWIAGDSVLAVFRRRPGGDSARVALDRLDARGAAKTFYRSKPKARRGDDSTAATAKPPSLSYARGREIRLRMTQPDTGEAAVEKVEIRGQVEGVQLEPGRADSARARGVLPAGGAQPALPTGTLAPGGRPPR